MTNVSRETARTTRSAAAIIWILLVIPSIASAGPTPYGGTPVALPGTIRAANYDVGGEGVAYHDTTAGNSGGAYRQDGVDLEASSAGGYDIGWTAAGEWLNYSVNVSAAGSYTARLRVASPYGGQLHLGFNTSSNVWKSVTVPVTGGWQSWTTVEVPVTLGAGRQLMTVLFDTGKTNFAYVEVVRAGTSGSGSSSPGPYSGTPVPVPGTIPAADFDNGGEGRAYHDTTAGNSGSTYRSTDVDIQSCSEGGYNLAWTDAGEWLNYTVNVGSAGSYTAQLRVASPDGGSLHIGFNTASNVWKTVTVPATGGWQSWRTVEVPVTLAAGVQQMTLLFDTGRTNLASVKVAAGTTSPGSSGGIIRVPDGGDLQDAIDRAQPGDTILLAPGATYAGSFELPAKGGTSHITIRSGASDSSLPGPGVRLTPQYAPSLAKIQGGIAGMPAFTTKPGAHHYRLQFLEIVNTYAANDIVQLGDGSRLQDTAAEVPHHLEIDRCYIHGNPTYGQKRGISLNSASTTIVNSYISDIKSKQEDAQAIAGWNGPGPYTIENNYLEATGEVFLLGGADPKIANMVPSDVSFRYNHVTKRTAWRGQGWVIKNLIEFKNAQRVVIDRNLLENSWAEAQQGFAIVLTPRNQEGTAPWSVVQNIDITNNTIQHVASGVNILALDSSTTVVTNDIVIRNNLFLDISSARWGGRAQMLLTQGGRNITVDHNTVFTDGSSVVYADVTTVEGFVFTNNIIPDNGWAVMGSGAAEGNGTLARYFPNATFRRNVVIAGNGSVYPTDNHFPATLSAVGFVDPSSGNYRLSSASPYNNLGTDGADIGCNQDALRR